MMRIARVFPRRTKATPDDELTFADGPGFFPPDVDEVHVSVAFTWDLARAEQLAREWKDVAPVKIGGPATGERSGEFVPGRYLKTGYTITSRGCPNRCWFCAAWKREDGLRVLPIYDGWNVLDDNLLACPEDHIQNVFAMLRRQYHSAEFTGGLEAALLRQWHVDLLKDLKPKQVFFAYDTPNDFEPLLDASKMLLSAGFTAASHVLRCYVLVGYPGDTTDNAEARLRSVLALGFSPMAMLFRDVSGETTQHWRNFAREWARPAIIHSRKIAA